MIFIDELPSMFEYHKNPKQLNLQAITIWITPSHFIVVPNNFRSGIPTILEIDRKTKLITEHAKLPEQHYNSGKPHYFSCLFGVINLEGKRVLLLAEEVSIVGSIGQRQIFRVVKPIYLFYDPSDKKALTEKEAQILLNTTAIFEQGIYFSFSYSLGSRLYTEPIEGGGLFNWAWNIQRQLQKFDRLWRVSIIQGFVGKLELIINGVKMTIVLISRRAVKRGGTHSYARGLDRQGNAGNYVETQQIIIMQEHYFSFVQVRGSAPLFWNQTKSSYGLTTPKCQGSIQANFYAFKSHLKLLDEHMQFNDIFLVNLLSSTNQQKKLVENYQYLVRKYKKEDTTKDETGCEIRYAYFDVHNQCKNKQYGHLNLYLSENLGPAIQYCGFTTLKIDKTNKKINKLTEQVGTFRTNCYNCIDRTNIVQSRIAALKLMEILGYLQIEINQFKDGLAFFATDSAFSHMYRNLWADNGDALSKQYTGTGSTQSFAVRKGKLSYMTTLDHGMKSIFRVIRNIRNEDEKKQEAICFILGQKMSDYTSQYKQQQIPYSLHSRSAYRKLSSPQGNPLMREI